MDDLRFPLAQGRHGFKPTLGLGFREALRVSHLRVRGAQGCRLAVIRVQGLKWSCRVFGGGFGILSGRPWWAASRRAYRLRSRCSASPGSWDGHPHPGSTALLNPNQPVGSLNNHEYQLPEDIRAFWIAGPNPCRHPT